MKNIYERQGRFTKNKFPDAMPLEHCLKLIEESKELKSAIFHEHSKDEILEELSDNLLCVFAISYKQGYSFEELLASIIDKMDINDSREWIKMPDGTYKHA